MTGIKGKGKKDVLKTKKMLHPNSRKLNAIVKRSHKSATKQKAKLLNTMKHQLVGEKLMWFKQNMFPDKCQWSEFDLADLLIKYIGRNDEELEQIEIKRSIGRRGRQHASREDVILMTKKEEQTQFDTCGIEIPNLFNRKQCEMLRNWDGDLKLLPNFKFRRFGRKHLTDAMSREMQRIEKQKMDSDNSLSSTALLQHSENGEDAISTLL